VKRGQAVRRSGEEIRRQTWITIQETEPRRRLELQQSADIAAGEADAILIAALAPDTAILLVDDKRARKVAMARGLRVLRPGALLVTALHRGQLGADDVELAVDTLIRERYFDSLARSHGPHLGSLDRRDRRGFSINRGELDLEAPPL